MFEIVHTVTDWYDGPRKGIADYQGKPHLFQSDWKDGENLDAETFSLMPIDGPTLVLALEEWAMYRRWEELYYGAPVTEETDLDAPPFLPEDRSRHAELERLLEGRLVIDPTLSVQKKAEFRVRDDPSWSGRGTRPLEVQWAGLD